MERRKNKQEKCETNRHNREQAEKEETARDVGILTLNNLRKKADLERHKVAIREEGEMGNKVVGEIGKNLRFWQSFGRLPLEYVVPFRAMGE